MDIIIRISRDLVFALCQVPTMVEAFPVYLPRQRQLIAAWVILPMLSTIIVGLRFYAKTKTRGLIGWSDWMIIASAVSSPALTSTKFGTCVLTLLTGPYGSLLRHSSSE